MSVLHMDLQTSCSLIKEEKFNKFYSGETSKMTLLQSITDAMDIALTKESIVA